MATKKTAKKTAKKNTAIKKANPKKAAKKKTTNKSQAIRDQLAKTPKASAKDIAAAASKKIKQEVPASLVYQVKANAGMKTNGRKKTASRSNGAGVDAVLIKEAAALLKKAGDPAAAKAALEVAADVGKMLGR